MIFDACYNTSKCKKLIRMLQCRLNILKNDRSYKAKQLREDISQLLHHGLQHYAFDKAETLFENEHEVTLYDLLDKCGEFMMNFSCSSKYKYFPNDINQAVSSLIFASSRLGDLPELKQIRKLFRKWYGKRFAKVALELLPGNLVNPQIKDCISAISETVSVEMKLRLMNEIAGICLRSRPLLIEHPVAESSHDGEKISEDNGTRSGDIIIEIGDQVDHNDGELSELNPRTSLIPFRDQKDGVEEIGFSRAVESSSESSAAFPKAIIYSDEIEEHESAVISEGSILDQRVFKFPSKSVSRIEKLERVGHKYHKEHCRNKHLKRKSRIPRKKSISVAKFSMIDSESAIYYELDSYESSQSKDHVNEEPEVKSHHKCSEENPCYLCKREGVDYLVWQSLESLSPEEKEEFIQDGLICKRALSMPPERLEKSDSMENISRIPKSNSLGNMTPACHDSHVHPKLPDYDDLITRFNAIKQAYMECKA